MSLTFQRGTSATTSGGFDSAGNFSLVGGQFIGAGTGLTGTAASLTAGNATNLGGVAASGYARSGANTDITSLQTGVFIVSTGVESQISMSYAAQAKASYHFKNVAGVGHWNFTDSVMMWRADYAGNFYATSFNGSGSGLTGTAAGLTAGAVSVTSPSASIGYAAGSGGSVTQTGSKGGSVTLNRFSGRITMNNAALASGVWAGFTCSCSGVLATDNVVVNYVGGAYSPTDYTIIAQPFANQIVIYVKNNTGSSQSDAVQIQYCVIRGAIT